MESRASRSVARIEHTIIEGECVEHLKSMATGSVHAVVTDPPYAIRSPGSTDEFSASDVMAGAMLGHTSQNWHETATHSRGYADNNPHAFQHWCETWLTECLRVLKPGGHLIAFGGTRAWHRLVVAAEDCGFEIRDSLAWIYTSGFPKHPDVADLLARRENSLRSYADAEAWRGWKTGLRPAHEPILLARKPLGGTIADNLETHQTGALNIRDTRVDGKWTPNVALDDPAAAEAGHSLGRPASVCFYVAKPNQAERVAVDGVEHPTVKPLTLMRHLVRLVTPPDGLVIDPFAGSGTTAEACVIEGFKSLSIERDPDYVALIRRRLARRIEPAAGPADTWTLPL